jgi:hypothetical protein
MLASAKTSSEPLTISMDIKNFAAKKKLVGSTTNPNTPLKTADPKPFKTKAELAALRKEMMKTNKSCKSVLSTSTTTSIMR